MEAWGGGGEGPILDFFLVCNCKPAPSLVPCNLWGLRPGPLPAVKPHMLLYLTMLLMALMHSGSFGPHT